ncbi:MAG: Na+/H+ antiporter NhaC family protein [Alloprevotella sp.]|nr:Na+/H+ antiporter NhaC family protein [Alloprevotella sp.]
MPARNAILKRNGLLALSPLAVMVLLFVVLSLFCGGFSKVPLLVVFLCTSAYALTTLRGMRLEERIRVFSDGAGAPDLLLMVWIFILAGAFASAAKAMGAIDAAVALCLWVLPAGMLLPGLFLAGCFVSLSIGTSVGTIVALVPVAAGLAQPSGMAIVLPVAAVVSGAFFGDNLSFISDTTVVATRTQGCQMRDKFLMNLRVALPAALLSLLVYAVLGSDTSSSPAVSEGHPAWLVLPYACVLVTAVLGLNVVLVLALGIVLTGLLGIGSGAFDLPGWFAALCDGIGAMGELIIVSMLAGGLLAVMRRGGGITWLMRRLTRHVRTPRGAQISIAALVSLTNVCTANNTVAILSVGALAHDISVRFGIDPRRTASVLDSFSCVVQGLLPYGAQLLIAAGLSGVAPGGLIPYLSYPALLGLCMLAAILWPGRRRIVS